VTRHVSGGASLLVFLYVLACDESSKLVDERAQCVCDAHEDVAFGGGRCEDEPCEGDVDAKHVDDDDVGEEPSHVDDVGEQSSLERQHGFHYVLLRAWVCEPMSDNDIVLHELVHVLW